MLEDLLNQIDQKKEELENLRPIKPEYLSRIKDKFKLEYNYYSNHIEGNTLTLGETKSLILHSYLTSIDKKLKDVEEMRAHIEQYVQVGFLQDKILTKDRKPLELNQVFIRELHKEIFVEDEKRKVGDGWVDIPAGQYKTAPNHVKTITREVFSYAEPEQVPQMMSDLIDWYNQARLNWHPVVLAGTFHYKFSRIHPFGDANGRMARFLMNLILQSAGYMLAVVKDGRSKTDYLQALEKTDRNFPDIQDSLQSTEAELFEPFVEKVARLVLENAELMIRGAKGEDISEAGDILKQFRMEMKANKKEKPNDRFWLTKSDNLPKLLKESIIPLLQKIEEFCFILAEENFAQMVSKVSFAKDGSLKISKIESQKEFVANQNNFYSTISSLNSLTSVGSYEKKPYPKCFVGNYKNGQKQPNNWSDLLDWYREDVESFERIKNLSIVYDFEGYNLNRAKNLQLNIEFIFNDLDWIIQISFEKNTEVRKFQYGHQVSEEDIKEFLRFLVSKSKSILQTV